MLKARMAKDLKECSNSELVAELLQRKLKGLPKDPTMTQMEQAVTSLLDDPDGHQSPIAIMLAAMEPEKSTAKPCPICGKLVPVKARDRSRTIQTLAGEVSFRRNYHWCQACNAGFYPLDRHLSLPEQGDVTTELEKRIIDFAVTGPFSHGAERWQVHYPQYPISANLLRRVADRVGVRCENADGVRLQVEALAPPIRTDEIAIVATDGSMLPMRGDEPWKEAKIAVIFRSSEYLPHHEAPRGEVSRARYVATLGGQIVFSEELKHALDAEQIKSAKSIAWLGDGAPGNWTLCNELCPEAIQILDWHHAIEHAMDCGKRLLGEGSDFLPLWQRRSEQLLMGIGVSQFIDELMECFSAANDDGCAAMNDLIRYYRTNEHRMHYLWCAANDLPIGSGFVESAHRHVLQTRMKCAGQHWSQLRAGRMARLRAIYRTAGPARFHEAINRAAA